MTRDSNLLFWATLYLCPVVRQTQPKRRMNERTDAGNRILLHYSLKMWYLVAIILMIFLITNWPISFIYWLISDSYPPLKFIWIAVRFPRRMDAPRRHSGQRYKRTNERTDRRTDGQKDASFCPSVRPSVCSSFRWSLTLTVIWLFPVVYFSEVNYCYGDWRTSYNTVSNELCD